MHDGDDLCAELGLLHRRGGPGKGKVTRAALLQLLVNISYVLASVYIMCIYVYSPYIAGCFRRSGSRRTVLRVWLLHAPD